MPHPQKSNLDIDFTKQERVRYGEFADEAQIRLLLMLGHAENSIFKFDVFKAMWFIREILKTPWKNALDTSIKGCFGVIGPRGGPLEALAMLMLSQQWYSHAPFLEELIVYVHPEHREMKKGNATALLNWMIAQSEKNSIPLLTGVLTQTRMEAKCRLYERKLQPVGKFFLHMPEAMRWESDVMLSDMIRPRSSAAA